MQFLTAYEVGIPLPAMFQEWVSFSQRAISPEDQPSITLGLLIARFIEMSSYVRFNVLNDGKPTTTSTIEKLLGLDDEFSDWEGSLDGFWRYKTEKSAHLPAAAVFEGEYHNYYDMWIARIWNHYRWSRILLNQLILDMVNSNPVSGQSLVSDDGRQERLAVIKRLARDILASTPSHWRHPLLGDNAAVPVQQKGGGGAGAAGVPILLFQLQVAACAPGVPPKFWNWAYGVLECIWGDMGMLHAKTMMDTMLAHRESMNNRAPRTTGPSTAKGSESNPWMKTSDPWGQAHL
jgi:hypothetical protein